MAGLVYRPVENIAVPAAILAVTAKELAARTVLVFEWRHLGVITGLAHLLLTAGERVGVGARPGITAAARQHRKRDRGQECAVSQQAATGKVSHFCATRVSVSGMITKAGTASNLMTVDMEVHFPVSGSGWPSATRGSA